MAAGERRTLSFSIPHEQLALVNAFEKTVVEPGEFAVMIGGSSKLAQLVHGAFRVEGESFSFDWLPGVARSSSWNEIVEIPRSVGPTGLF